jgi:hypothetical protein
LSLRDLTPEEVERIVEKISKEVVKRDLELPANMFLESIYPVANYGTQLFTLGVGSWLYFIWESGYDYSSFFMNRENVRKLIERIDQRSQERDEKRRKSKETSEQIAKERGLKLYVPLAFEVKRNESGPLNGVLELVSDEGNIHRSFMVVYRNAETDAFPTYADFERFALCSEVTDLLGIQMIIHPDEGRMRRQVRIGGHTAFSFGNKMDSTALGSGSVTFFGFWCDETRRSFVIAALTADGSGDSKSHEKALRQILEVLRSFECHSKPSAMNELIPRLRSLMRMT